MFEVEYENVFFKVLKRQLDSSLLFNLSWVPVWEVKIEPITDALLFIDADDGLDESDSSISSTCNHQLLTESCMAISSKIFDINILSYIADFLVHTGISFTSIVSVLLDKVVFDVIIFFAVELLLFWRFKILLFISDLIISLIWDWAISQLLHILNSQLLSCLSIRSKLITSLHPYSANLHFAFKI
jgi:hypothetical protein